MGLQEKLWQLLSVAITVASLALHYSSVEPPVTIFAAIGTYFIMRGAIFAVDKRCLLVGTYLVGMSAVLIAGCIVASADNLQFNASLGGEMLQPDLVMRALATIGVTAGVFDVVCIRNCPRIVVAIDEASLKEQAVGRRILLYSLSLGSLFNYVTIRGVDLRETGYGSQAFIDARSMVDNPGLELGGLFLLAASLVAAWRVYGLFHVHFNLVVVYIVLTIIVTRTLRGDRAGSLVVFATLFLIVFVGLRAGKSVVTLITAGLFGALAVVFQVWGYVRWNLWDRGAARAFKEGFEQLSGGSTEFDPLQIQLIPASFWHLLHAVDLRELGLGPGLGGFGNLVPQLVPSVIADLLKYERPPNGPWMLAEFRIHGGGFFLPAEAYWYGGIIGSIGLAIVLGTAMSLVEKWYRSKVPLFLSVYFPLIGSFGFGLYYGLQPFVKSLFLAGVLSVVLTRIYDGYRTR